MAAATTKGSTEARLIELIGPEKTEALLCRYRGHTLYVPSGEIDEYHPLAQAVGMDAAAAVCREWAGLPLPLPLGADRWRDARNQRIRAARAAGATVPELVDRFGLCKRSIHAIIGPRSASPTEGAATLAGQNPHHKAPPGNS